MEKINFKNKLFVNFVAGAVVFLNICSMPVSMAMIEPPKSAPHQIVNYEYGVTPLMQAVVREDVAEVSRYLQTMSLRDINLTGGLGCTALMHAARDVRSKSARVEIVRLILNRGADVNVQSDENCATALIIAVSIGDLDVVRMLIERRANVNVQTMNGHSALSVAVEGGHVDIVRLLLENQADANSRTPSGTILDCARRVGNPTIIRMLIDYGAI